MSWFVPSSTKSEVTLIVISPVTVPALIAANKLPVALVSEVYVCPEPTGIVPANVAVPIVYVLVLVIGALPEARATVVGVAVNTAALADTFGVVARY